MGEAGRAAEPVAEAADFAMGSDRAADERQTLACVYAVASDKTADRKAEHADRAVGLLRKAVAAGLNKPADLKEDKDLDSVRNREDCQKLIAEVEAKVENALKAAPPREKK